MHEGDVLLDTYRVDRVATEGLIVNVDATHMNSACPVRIVLLAPHARGFDEACDHFMRTGRMVAQMQSEHVARVMDLGILDTGAPFLITEHAGSGDLGELLQSNGPLGVVDTVDFAIQIAAALAEAHVQGMIHGSLRPSNVLVSEGIDGTPVIRLIGFGALSSWSMHSMSLVAPTHRHQTASHRVLAYLAPEQVRTLGDVDARSDIWALGALLYEMLVGTPVFGDESTAALLASIVADPAPVVTTVRGDVPRQLESIISRCLEKGRDARFVSISEFARAIQPFGSHESHALAERVVRIMARGSLHSLHHSRPKHALVHMATGYQSSHQRASQAASSRSAAPRVAAPVTRFRVNSAAGLVALLGAAAGVTGAFIETHFLHPTVVASTRQDPAEQQAGGTNNSMVSNTSVDARPPVQRVATGVGQAEIQQAAKSESAPQTPRTPTTTAQHKAAMPAHPYASKLPISTLPAKVLPRVESKQPPATGSQLFDDIN